MLLSVRFGWVFPDESVKMCAGHSPSHLMDILLQLTALAKDNVPHILPLIRWGASHSDSIKVIRIKVGCRVSNVMNLNFACSLTTNITSHSMENLAFHSFTQTKDNNTTNSHYLPCTFLFKRLGECTFWTNHYSIQTVLACVMKHWI